MPQVMKSLLAPTGVTAATVTPAPDSVEVAPTEAMFFTTATLTPIAAATAVPSVVAAPAVALPVASVSRLACTTTAPLEPDTVRDPLILAMLTEMTTLTEKAAPKATLLQPEADWPPA